MKKIVLFLCMLPVLAFAQAVLPTSWSFVSPSPTGASTATVTGTITTYNTKVGWSTKLDLTGPQGGGTAFVYATGSDGNAACRLDQGNEYVLVNFAEQADSAVYFLRSWVGGSSSPTAFDGEFRVEESADGNAWTTIRSFTAGQISISSYVRFATKIGASARYVRFVFTTKVSGINIGLDNVIIQPAPPTGSQKIIVENDSADVILNNSVFVIGNASKKTLRIRNTGITASLNIDSIVLSGVNASDFSLGSFNSVISATNSDTVTINFNPSASGSRFSVLKIYNNDPEKNPYTIDLYAIGGQLATEPINQVGAVNISNVKTYMLNVSFSRAAAAEKYILLRKTAATLTDVPLDGTTYQRGDYIGNAQVAYIGDDTAMLTPNYILANTSYSFAAFAFNGPAGYENYNTTAAPTATATTLGSTPGSYYNNIDTNNLNFVTALGSRVRLPHDTVFYS
ncbi:MAG: hypothetical protein KBE91_07765, partial [Bacteroidia bacterium]|nr:hypothetical protein [Bacteroidia bacterium]